MSRERSQANASQCRRATRSGAAIGAPAESEDVRRAELSGPASHHDSLSATAFLPRNPFTDNLNRVILGRPRMFRRALFALAASALFLGLANVALADGPPSLTGTIDSP